jgi:hypothetical protein
MTPKGNSRANGISERESNNEANCEAECNIARHNLAGAFSVGGDGGRKSPEDSRATSHVVAAASDCRNNRDLWVNALATIV